MSELQIGLALLGGLVLAGLVGHGVWQARRGAVREASAGVAETPTPREPMFGADASPDTVPAARLEPMLVRRGPRLDALIDAIATLRLDAPVAGETAIQHLPPARRAGSKPLLIEGLDGETGEWDAPQPGRRYGEFQAGVQLANRGGALNEIEYSEFVQKAQLFADSLGALADFPDMLDVVARARELDAFAAQHDAQLTLKLVSRGASWTPAYVQQHAAAQGFVPGALPGRLVRPAAEEGAPAPLTLQFDAQAALADEPAQALLRELQLVFDVPQTAVGEGAFVAWCRAGEGLAGALDAAMFDNDGHPLPPGAFAVIGQELDRLYGALAERDLAAGSPAARRLFS